MPLYIGYDEDGNEYYDVVEDTATTNLANEIQVDDGAIHIDAHNAQGHLVIRADPNTDAKFISCIDSTNNTEKVNVTTAGVTNSIGVATGVLAVTGDSALVGNTDFGAVNDKVMEVTGSGIQVNKETLLDGATYSTGGIALLKDAVLGFKPYDGDTPLPAGNLYTFGRHSQIGDLTHENDGVCLRSLSSVNGLNQPHTVLICPDPNDPNIVIHSQKNNDYLKFIAGPDDDPMVNEVDVRFRVKHNGDIISRQMSQIMNRLEALDSMVALISYNLNQLPAVHDNLPDLQAYMSENNIEIPPDQFNQIFGTAIQ